MTRGGQVRQILLLLVAMTTVTKIDAQHCSYDQPLGMINHEIRDWQIKASTEFKEGGTTTCLAKYARLYSEDGYSWCPGYHGTSEWLEVNLGIEATVTGVVTQGRGRGKEFVKTFKMAYTNDGKTWKDILDEYMSPRIFEGNSDAYQPRYNYLESAIVAKSVRVMPQTYSVRASMRVEFLGCQPCKTLLSSVAIKASSFKGRRRKRNCLPEYGHILSNKGWCPKKQKVDEHIEFDFGPPVKVTAVVTKGRGDGRRKSYVSSFRLAYTNDTSRWNFYKSEVFRAPEDRWTHHVTANGTVFRGNSDRNTENVHFLVSPFVARFVRVHVSSWVNKIGLRAGFYGCPHTGPCGPGFFRPNADTSCRSNVAFGAPVFVLRSRRTSAAAGGLRKRKRHAGNSWRRVRAPFDASVDYLDVGGVRRPGRSACLTLTNSEIPVPVIRINLPGRQMVNGVYLYTGLNVTGVVGSEAEQLKLLTKIDASVLKSRRRRQEPKSVQNCGFVSSLNNALLRSRIHIGCAQQMRGSSIYLRMHAKAGFKAAWRVCNVVVY